MCVGGMKTLCDLFNFLWQTILCDSRDIRRHQIESLMNHSIIFNMFKETYFIDLYIHVSSICNPVQTRDH